jgi:hypothetical protein
MAEPRHCTSLPGVVPQEYIDPYMTNGPVRIYSGSPWCLTRRRFTAPGLRGLLRAALVAALYYAASAR